MPSGDKAAYVPVSKLHFPGAAGAPIPGTLTLHRYPPGAPGRADLEATVRAAFCRSYAADVSEFSDQLLGIRRDGGLIGVVGLRAGAGQPMFCEQYLDEPVAAMIERHGGAPCDPATVVEIGNLAVTVPGTGRVMYGALCAFLHGAGFEWTVFTAVAPLRHALRRMGFAPQTVTPARPDRLRGGASRWGRYYECGAQVCIGSIRHAHQRLPLLRARQHPLVQLFWDAARTAGAALRAQPAVAQAVRQ